MALDRLLDSLARDVEGEARQILDAARAEAARIRAEADAQAARRCAEAIATRETALRVQMDAHLARARRDARVATLVAREAFLDRTFEAVEAELPRALDAPEHADVLAQLASEALEFFPDTPAVVRCRAGLAERVREIAASLGAANVSRDDSVPEGVIVEAADASAAVHNTLIERLRRLRPLLAIELVARMESAS